MCFTPRFRAILQALLVTFLWSTSWVLIKFALNDIPPLTFAGLRYTIAFLVLLPGLLKHRIAIRALSRTE
jgi:drug/metabolite transporter (DMT)-like permease